MPRSPRVARKRFEKQGIKILTGAKVTGVEKGADSVTATIDDGKGGTQKITAERLISAVGVVGNIENLGLEKLGVKIDRGTIVTDGLGRTNVPGLYAIGDVAGPPMLAHKAEHEGVICVEGIKGLHPHAMDKGKIPGCTYCNPQVASVGITEAEGQGAGLDIRVGRFPFVGNGKAIALGEPDGLVKTIFDKKTGQLLGAHHGRRRGDRADPGLRHRHEPRDHRGRADPRRLPAPDPVGDDARERSRRLRPGDPHLSRSPESRPRIEPWPLFSRYRQQALLRETSMSILAWIGVGILAGWLAEKITGSDHGLITNLIVGIIGAFIGGFLMSALFGYRLDQGFNIATILVATLGAVALLLIVGLIRGRRPSY